MKSVLFRYCYSLRRRHRHLPSASLAERDGKLMWRDKNYSMLRKSTIFPSKSTWHRMLNTTENSSTHEFFFLRTLMMVIDRLLFFSIFSHQNSVSTDTVGNSCWFSSSKECSWTWIHRTFPRYFSYQTVDKPHSSLLDRSRSTQRDIAEKYLNELRDRQVHHGLFNHLESSFAESSHRQIWSRWSDIDDIREIRIATSASNSQFNKSKSVCRRSRARYNWLSGKSSAESISWWISLMSRNREILHLKISIVRRMIGRFIIRPLGKWIRATRRSRKVRLTTMIRFDHRAFWFSATT